MPIPILMYHQIGPMPPAGSPYRGLTVHPARFCRQMTWLRRFGYRGVSMRDLMPYVRGERQGKVIGITFDDGYRNVHHHALPILRELEFTATNYFVARQFDGANVWDADKGVPSSPLMSVAEMREWAAAGMEVGSHTLDHVHLPQLTPDEAMRQIADSRRELEAALGQAVTAFCYPYGEYTQDHCRMTRAAGYDNATVTRRGLVHAGDDPYELKRVLVAGGTSLFSFLRKTLTSYEDKRRRR